MERILKLITINGHGNGGHVYSCRTISDHMSKLLNITVSSIGQGRSAKIAESEHFDRHFDTKSKLHFFKLIRSYLKNFDIIHAYDEQSLSVAILFSPSNAKIVFTKCGGPNYKHQVRCDNTICFSLENFSYQKQKKTKNLALIPNRVQDEDFIETVPSLPKKNQFRILKIGRITDYYEESLRKGITLRDRLIELGVSAEYTVIGVVESKTICSMLLENGVKVKSGKKYTSNAALNIDQYDIVVGTGRGAVEAIARRKIVYLATKKSELPTLLTTSNIKEAFNFNFSERTVFSEIHNDQSTELASHDNFLELTKTTEWQPFSFVKEMFSVSEAECDYKNFYSSSLRGPQLSFRNLLHAIRNVVRL